MWELPLGSGHSWRGFAHVRPCRTLWWGSPRFAVRRVVAESAAACCWDASGMCWRAFPHGDMQLHVPIKHEVRWSGKRRKQNGLDFCVDAQKQFLMNGLGLSTQKNRPSLLRRCGVVHFTYPISRASWSRALEIFCFQMYRKSLSHWMAVALSLSVNSVDAAMWIS